MPPNTISYQARRFLAGFRFRAAVETDFFVPDNRTSSSRLKVLRFLFSLPEKRLDTSHSFAPPGNVFARGASVRVRSRGG